MRVDGVVKWSLRVKGLDIPELLRASYAKPWCDATDSERPEPFNDFLLEARFDTSFLTKD